MLNRMFFRLLFNVVYKMKCSILWKKTNKHVLCATDYEVMLHGSGHDDADETHATQWTLGRTNRHRNSTGTGSQNPSCSALLKVWPPVRSARFIDANSYTVASPLIIVGETKTKNDWRPGSINDTMHLVKQHPPLQTANMYTSLSSYVHYFIHITVSSTLRLTYNNNHQHFHKENLIELIYCSGQPLGYTFIYRMKRSALH